MDGWTDGLMDRHTIYIHTYKLPLSVKGSKDDKKVKWHEFLSPLDKTVPTSLRKDSYAYFADVNL